MPPPPPPKKKRRRRKKVFMWTQITLIGKTSQFQWRHAIIVIESSSCFRRNDYMATQRTLSKIQNVREARPVDGGAGEGVLTQRRSARLSRSTVGARECRHTHDVVPTSGEGKPPRANVPPMPEVHQRSYWSLPPRTLKQQMAELVVQQAICTLKMWNRT